MTSWTRIRFAFVAGLVLSTLGYCAVLFHASAFWRIGVAQMLPCFMDLRIVLAAADCARQGHNVFLQNPCAPSGYLYNYSSLLLKAMVSGGISQNQTEVVGLILVTVFSIVSGLVLAPRNRFEFFASLGVMTSPAVMLGMERANIDLPIMVGIAVAGVGAALAGAGGWALAAAGLVPGILSKYYPVMAVPALAMVEKKASDRVFIVEIGLIVLCGYFLGFQKDIDNVRHFTPVPGYFPACFGGINLFSLLFPPLPAHLMAIFAAVPVFFGARWVHGRIGGCPMRRISASLMLAGAGTYLGCFFLNSNWDYRRIFLILVFPGLFDLCGARSPGAKKVGVVSVLLALIGLWAIFWSRGLPNTPEAMWRAVPRPLVILKELVDWMLVFSIAVSAFFAIDRVSDVTQEFVDGDSA